MLGELAGTNGAMAQCLAAGPFQRAGQPLGDGAGALPVAGNRLMSGVGQARRCDQAGQAAIPERFRVRS